MKSWKISSYLTLAILAPCLLFSGCGGGTGATVTTVGISSSVGNALILGQSTTLTATVVGPANTDATWMPGQPKGTDCTYTTTTTNSSGTPVTAAAKVCPTDGSFGTLSNEQTTSPATATFLAPSKLPDPTTFPALVLTVTVQSVADASSHGTGTIQLTIQSGITISLNPSTAAVPTNEKQPFFAILTNDLKAQGVTWSLTQSTPTTTTPTTPNPLAALPTCTVSGNATGCGSIDANGIYSAPTAVPTASVPANASTTPTDVTIVATSVEDPTQFTTGTISITQGGPITFNGISPTIAPQGAAFWDIYLNAPNMSSASQVTITQNGGATPINSASGQVKVLFPIPTCTATATTTCAPQSSSGARLRLFANNLATAGPVTVSVTDSGEPVTTCTGTPLPAGCNFAGTFTYNILPVRPTTLNSTPNDIVQGVASSGGTTPITIDGGYFGNGGQSAQASFQGTTLSGTTNGQGQPLSNALQLHVQVQSNQINSSLPGLYPLSVSSGSTPPPFANNAAITDLAIFPSYASNPPVLVGSPVPAGANPSAIGIDPTLGVIAVAEVGPDAGPDITTPGAVQFYSIGSGTLTPLGTPVPVGKAPTGLSVNPTNHTVAVVNYRDQTITVLPIPGAPVQAPGTPFTLDISGVLQGQVSPAPLPYSIGVDPDTNMAVVAYSSTAASTAANLGFLINLNTGNTPPFGCIKNTPGPGPCVFAQVTLNTGSYPQVAMAPHGHLAFVSPGGQGTLQGIDVTKPSTSAAIQSLTLAAGIVTVVTTASNGLIPGNSGTVLISGVPGPGTASNSSTFNFNGVYVVSAISDTSFTYFVNSTSSGTVNITLNSDGTSPANVFYSTPNLTFGGLSPFTQGIAINPVTNTAALADPNATGSRTNTPQINLINNLDQTISSISFAATCTFYTVTLPCANSVELGGTANVAWQPYSNAVVSYNSRINQVSVSDPVSALRYAFACNPGTPPAACLVNPQNATDQATFNTQTTLPGTGTATLPVTNGTTNSLSLFGGLTVDPVTNQAFVLMSGTGQIDIIDLGPCRAVPPPNTGIITPCPNPFNTIKSVQITEILVPSPNAGPGVIGGIPNATVPQGTLTSATALPGVQIFGSGFDGTTQVLLDGGAIPQTNVQLVSNRLLSVTIPAANLSFPHRYALTAVSTVNGNPVASNATDFFVIQAVDLSKVCTSTAGTQPSSVAIADQLANGPFSPIAVVTNSGCNNISVVDINPTATVNGQTVQNPNFGTILHSIAVGATPQGIAVSQPFGLAVVANNSAGTASIVNLVTGTLAVPDVSTGTNPAGVAINDATGAAIVANTGSNTITEINLGALFTNPPATTLAPVSAGGFQEATAVAIDPDRGTNNQGIAVVTTLQLQSGAAPQGGLQVADIGLATPILSTTLNTGSVTAPATGIVFDPIVATGTANPGVFYASSSGGNVITSFNPDNSGSATTVNVGINPTALAINPETGAILTTNLAGKTSSLVDTTSSPLKTVKTIGLPGSGQFGVAIDQFTNIAVIVDQGNNRLLIFAMPN
jgi:hypothetical protein